MQKRNVLLLLVLLILVAAAIFMFNRKDNAENKQVYQADTSAGLVKQNNIREHYYGVDVSHWNGDILEDIDKMDSLSFGICKATEGLDYVDPDFKQNWKLLAEKGLIRGAYHFLLVKEDPVTQAEHYYKTLGPADGEKQMTYIVDVEAGSLSVKDQDGATIQKVLLSFLDHIELLTNQTPMIYTNYAFANQYLNDPALTKYPLWLAEYSGGASPEIPVAWKAEGYTIWQKSDHYDISSNAVDYDEYHGQLSDLY